MLENLFIPHFLERCFGKHHSAFWQGLVFLLLTVVTLLAYANSFANPFYTDDATFFNKGVTDLRYFFYNFLPNRDALLGIQRLQGEFFYRPLSHVVPSLAYAEFGRAVWGHHLVNIFLLALAGWGIFRLIISITGDFVWGVLAGLFYVVHPINGVVVNYVTAGVFGLQAFAMIYALLSIHNNRTNQAVFWSLIAILCHEMAMMLPFYAGWMLLMKGDSVKEIWRKTWKLWALLAFYFLFRFFFISWNAIIFSKVQHYDMNIFQYLAAQAKIVLWYVSRLFYPQGIVIIWSTLVFKGSVVVLWILAGLAFIAFMAAAIYHYRRSYLMSVVLGWFVLGFLPVSLASLFRPPHGLMIEPHWFVFPSIGFFIWLAFLLKDKWRMLSVIFILVWLTIGYRYNQLWSNEKQYCLTWLNEVPHMKAAAYVLGDIYAVEGKWDEAIYYFQRSFRGTYQDFLTYLKIGILEAEQEHWAEAVVALQNAARIAPREPSVQNALKHFQKLLSVKGIQLKIKKI